MIPSVDSYFQDFQDFRLRNSFDPFTSGARFSAESLAIGQNDGAKPRLRQEPASRSSRCTREAKHSRDETMWNVGDQITDSESHL